MTTATLKRGIGILSDRQNAALALTDLKDANFDMDRVSAISAGQESSAQQEVSPTAAKAGVTGLVTGGLGSLVGLLGGMAVALVLPGVGAAADAGIALISTVIGGTVGATGGSLVSALTGWGVSEKDAIYYNESIARGEYLILVEGSPVELERARQILAKRNLRDWSEGTV